eukprot:14032162-Alexandrium_andersonii.AAC.1
MGSWAPPTTAVAKGCSGSSPWRGQVLRPLLLLVRIAWLLSSPPPMSAVGKGPTTNITNTAE